MASLIILVAMFVLLWALLIRPQRQRQQKQQQLLSSVEAGDEVLTVGGLYGIVRELDEDDDLIVEIAEGIQVRIARRAVAAVVKPEEDEGDAAEDDAAEDGVAEDGVAEDEPGSEGGQDAGEGTANTASDVEGSGDEEGIVSSEESVNPEATEATGESGHR